MLTTTLKDGAGSFLVSIYEPTIATNTVLFAVGAGGSPDRHTTLLNTLAEFGSRVIAPHFERLSSPVPTDTELMLRARRLSLSLDAFADHAVAVSGVGHSIGAATLLALSGAQMWVGPGQRVDIVPDRRLNRVALLAPPTGFFQAPEALKSLEIPMLIWVGSEDRITPPHQTEWLAEAVNNRQHVDVRIAEGAGHFSFMDKPPPQTTEPLPDKQAFLVEHSREVCKFVLG